MSAYYNEIDPDAAAILRVLIDEGLIAPGIVDERSIEDVLPDELAGYTQCHFFAGIGIWSLALRAAGVPDDTPVWTGSCPCQPFSAAGKGDGMDDERHLWPAFYHLISQCLPAEIRGEQVASKAIDPWIDLVHADLEALGYAFGSVPFPAAGVGAPHIRDRNYWCATHLAGRRVGADGATRGLADNLMQQRPDGESRIGSEDAPGRRLECPATTAGLRCSGGVADLQSSRHQGQPVRAERGLPAVGVANFSRPGRLADGAGSGRREEHEDAGGCADGDRPQGVAAGLVHGGGAGRLSDANGWANGGEGEVFARSNVGGLASSDGSGSAGRIAAGPTNGLWRAADWLLCRDGKWRPVEPSTFPLAPAGTFRNRVATLRGAGNAINLAQAQAFIEAVR